MLKPPSKESKRQFGDAKRTNFTGFADYHENRQKKEQQPHCTCIFPTTINMVLKQQHSESFQNNMQLIKEIHIHILLA